VTKSRKLIEVALPLEAINKASDVENNPFVKGHPKGLHKWWARRTLGSCRAILFASIVDAPQESLSEEEYDAQLDRLLEVTSGLAQWKPDPAVLAEARRLIRTALAGQDVVVVDPFAGGGTIPLEAARLGLPARASDLNPVAVLINKLMLELAPRLGGQAAQLGRVLPMAAPSGLGGFAADLRTAGDLVLDHARAAIGNVYDPGGRVWLWVRVSECSNPACRTSIPLTKSFVLLRKGSATVAASPQIEDGAVTFALTPGPAAPATVGSDGARCIRCGAITSFAELRGQAVEGRMSIVPVAVATGDKKAPFRPITATERARLQALVAPEFPDLPLPDRALGFRVQRYGLTNYRDFFTPRQSLALGTFAESIERVVSELVVSDDYRLALKVGLALALSRLTEYSNSLCSWDSGSGMIRRLFDGATVSMTWDFAESNVFDGQVSWSDAVKWVAGAVENLHDVAPTGRADLADARQAVKRVPRAVFSTDPPYYRNVGYADLSDFFYVWLRRMLKSDLPELFGTMSTPKTGEIISSPERMDGNADAADAAFEAGLREVFTLMRDRAEPDVPVTIHYAMKQQELRNHDGRGTSTGWERMLQALVDSGFEISATWPVATEQRSRRRARESNALDSSIVLACRPRGDAPTGTRATFSSALRDRLPAAVHRFRQANVSPVDLTQAAIGPGMEVFSRFGRVLEPDGSVMRVGAALAVINRVLDEVLAEDEGEFDPDTRWAIAWYEQYGLEEADFGRAEAIAKAKNTSIDGLVAAGIVQAGRSKVRLVKRDELPDQWDPSRDARLPVWEATQHLVRDLLRGGVPAAAFLAGELGGLGAIARDLAYRLYQVADGKGWAEEARVYNQLVVDWPDIVKTSRTLGRGQASQTSLGLE
jgi:putative DNA methylase